MKATETLVNTIEGARVLRVHPNTLRRLKDSGEIKFVRIGRRSVRYSIAELQRYIKKHQGFRTASESEETASESEE